MDQKLTVSVTPVLTAHYLTLARTSARDALTIALHRTDSDAMRTMIRELTENSALQVTIREDGWPERSLRYGPFVAFRATRHAGFLPVHEWVARHLAAEYADETDSPIADLTTERLLTPDQACASLYPKENGSLRLSDWVKVSGQPGDERISLATRGLRRFGMPEIRVDDLRYGLTDGWQSVLLGLACLLHRKYLAAVRDATPGGALPYATLAPADFEVPAEIEVTIEAVAEAYCLPQRGWTGGSRVRLAAYDGCLAVRAPGGWGWSWGDFTKSMCDDSLSGIIQAAAPFIDDFGEVMEPELVTMPINHPK
jgi:hypothetical protein